MNNEEVIEFMKKIFTQNTDLFKNAIFKNVYTFKL